MRFNRMNVLLILAVMGLTASCTSRSKQAQEQETIFGTWYVQTVDGEICDSQCHFSLAFEEDGVFRVYDRDGLQKEDGRFRHDPDKPELLVYKAGRTDDIYSTLKYSFEDGVVVLRFDENTFADCIAVMEMTRNPEGTSKHQQMRAALGNQPSVFTQMQSFSRMRAQLNGAMIYGIKNNNDVLPTSIGEVVAGGYCTPEDVIPPGSKQKTPDDFKDWEDQKKIEWVNRHTGYVYLGANKPTMMESHVLILFELPGSSDQKMVCMWFGDGHAEKNVYAEADAMVKDQTGHSLAQWMNTTTPGTGQMTPPQ